MTGRVDVLRVLDEVANGIHSPNEGEVCIAHHTLHAFLKARDVVAELIEALEKIKRRASHHPDDTNDDRTRNLYHCEAIARVALARIGGE